jgi:hypothetical protein
MNTEVQRQLSFAADEKEVERREETEDEREL